MSMRLPVLLRRNEGALLRVIGLLHRRGYQIAALDSRASAEPGLWQVTIELDGISDTRVLARQLERLIDVVAVGERACQAHANPHSANA